MNIAYNMDCMEGMKQFPDKYFDLAVVDPIYGDVTQGGYITGKSRGGVAAHPTYNMEMWKQPKTGSDYFDELFRVSKNQIIYSSDNFLNGKVIGEFVCDTILRNCEMANADIAEAQSCVKREKILEYSGGHEVFGWHVSDLVIYDKPKELSEFSGLRQTKFGLEPVSLKRPPQSWCYVESEEK